MIFSLVGPPGSGKDTQAHLLKDRFGLTIVSPGEVMRKAVSSGHILSTTIQQYIGSGKLVPDNIVNEAIRSFIEETQPENIIFTGFPRRKEQIMHLDNICTDFNHEFKALILMQVPDDIIVDRLAGRLYSPDSQRFYHEKYNPPQNPGVDDETGKPLIRRNDDNPQTIAAKLDVHKKEVAPVAQEFTQRNMLYRIEATGDINAVGGIIYRIVSKHMQPIKEVQLPSAQPE